jgi:hypothetical protein
MEVDEFSDKRLLVPVYILFWRVSTECARFDGIAEMLAQGSIYFFDFRY